MRREFKLECADGKQLYARVFEAESPRGVLCVAHGLGEHGDRYQKFADFMNAHGMTVYAQDHRGHGRNVEKKSQRGIARMADLERDMVTMIDFAAKETGLPVIQFGHSLGGLIGLYTTLHSKPVAQAGQCAAAGCVQGHRGVERCAFPLLHQQWHPLYCALSRSGSMRGL